MEYKLHANSREALVEVLKTAIHMDKREVLIEALKTASTVKEACASADVPIATYKYWMDMAVTHGGEYHEFRKSVIAACMSNPNTKRHHKHKHTAVIDGEPLSLKQVAQKYGINANLVRHRHTKHLQNPVAYPIETLIRPVRARVKYEPKLQPVKPTPSIHPGKGIAGMLESIADSLRRIADFCDRV